MPPSAPGRRATVGSPKKRPPKPPYRFCWSCSRQFHGPFYRVVETATGRVYVHAACVKDVDGRPVPDDVAGKEGR